MQEGREVGKDEGRREKRTEWEMKEKLRKKGNHA